MSTTTTQRRRYRFVEHGQPGYCDARYSRESAWSSDTPAMTLDAVVNRDNFVRTFKRVRSRAGDGGGIDGFSYHDFTITEVAEIAVEISRGIHASTWLPRQSKVRRILKADGKKKRRLDIRCVMDRLVSSAVSEVVAKPLEEMFLPSSFGFRPGKSVQGLLAVMAHYIEHEGYRVAGQDDVADAFPSVRINDSVCDYAAVVDDPGLVNLIEVILRGYKRSQKPRIEQGDPLSPLTLNLRLHNCLDLPSLATTGSDNPLRFRYADNLVYLCRSVSEGQRAIESDDALLRRSGFQLKREKNYPVDLRRSGSSITILGFVIRLEEDGVKFDLNNKAFQNLSVRLQRAHELPDSSAVAQEAIAGWIEMYGPVFESYGVSDYLRRAQRVAVCYGFREVGSYEHLRMLADRAASDWRTARVSFVEQFLLQVDRLSAAPQPCTGL